MIRIGYFHLENPQVVIQTMAQQEGFAVLVSFGGFSIVAPSLKGVASGEGEILRFAQNDRVRGVAGGS